MAEVQGAGNLVQVHARPVQLVKGFVLDGGAAGVDAMAEDGAAAILRHGQPCGFGLRLKESPLRTRHADARKSLGTLFLGGFLGASAVRGAGFVIGHAVFASVKVTARNLSVLQAFLDTKNIACSSIFP